MRIGARTPSIDARSSTGKSGASSSARASSIHAAMPAARSTITSSGGVAGVTSTVRSSFSSIQAPMSGRVCGWAGTCTRCGSSPMLRCPSVKSKRALRLGGGSSAKSSASFARSASPVRARSSISKVVCPRVLAPMAYISSVLASCSRSALYSASRSAKYSCARESAGRRVPCPLNTATETSYRALCLTVRGFERLARGRMRSSQKGRSGRA
jgi:hypothetical protein